MKKILVASLLALFSTHYTTAQHTHTDDHREQAKTERELAKAQRRGKISSEEQRAILEKKRELDRLESNAHRDGKIKAREERRIHRSQREFRKEVKRSKRNK